MIIPMYPKSSADPNISMHSFPPVITKEKVIMSRLSYETMLIALETIDNMNNRANRTICELKEQVARLNSRNNMFVLSKKGGVA